MIEISADTAIMLYLALSLGLILSLWLCHHLSKRKEKIILKEEILVHCEYCSSAYMADISKKLSLCPECKSFNKNQSSP